MADLAKLKKNVQKAQGAVDQSKIDLGAAIDAYGSAERVLAIAREELEHAEAMAMALELRKKGE